MRSIVKQAVLLRTITHMMRGNQTLFLFGHLLSQTYHREISRDDDVSEVADKLLSVRNLGCFGVYFIRSKACANS
jgi:hypothetical protein